MVPPLAAAFTGIVGSLLLANPVSYPRFNRFLDAVSRGEGMNQRTRRLRAVMLLGTALAVAVSASASRPLTSLGRPSTRP